MLLVSQDRGRFTMKKTVLFTGGVETQDYFSAQIEKTLKKLGHETFTFDYGKEAASCAKLLSFYERGNTAMLTFNFTGICNEAILRDENGTYIWESLGIPCYVRARHGQRLHQELLQGLLQHVQAQSRLSNRRR